MIDQDRQTQAPGKHRYQSVVQGIELANEFARSRLPMRRFGCSRSAGAPIMRGDGTTTERLS